jgi:hypothetical protein
MALNARILKRLNGIFTSDVKRSDYYQRLPPGERRALDARLTDEESELGYALLPGADEAELDKLCEAVQEKLGVPLPPEVADILRQVNGLLKMELRYSGSMENCAKIVSNRDLDC